jgi:hypothetical protein
MQVLSQGINITMHSGFVALEFGGLAGPPASLEDLRESDGYALGTKMYFQVYQY